MPIVVDSLTPQQLKDEWRTLPHLYNRLDREFGFRYDFAATPENALSSTFFTKENSALDADTWFHNERIAPVGFLNPPFSQASEFLAMANDQVAKAHSTYSYALICCLVRADAPETKWFRHHALDKFGRPKHELRYLYPRVSYVNAYGETKNMNQFPSMLIVMRSRPWNFVHWENWK